MLQFLLILIRRSLAEIIAARGHSPHGSRFGFSSHFYQNGGFAMRDKTKELWEQLGCNIIDHAPKAAEFTSLLVRSIGNLSPLGQKAISHALALLCRRRAHHSKSRLERYPNPDRYDTAAIVVPSLRQEVRTWC